MITNHKWIWLGLIMATCQVSAQISQDSLEMMIGQMIIVGVDQKDTGSMDSLLAEIRANKLGGVILYEKDLQSDSTKPALAKLVHLLQQDAPVPLFISIDEEGGLVNRLRPKYGFPKTLKASTLGKMDMVDSTYYYAEQTAISLYQFGFNLNYAPSVDLNINPDNPVIGKLGRSYSADHEKVARHASAFIRAHNDWQIATTIKHFPGHGSSTKDTHLGIADVSDTWQLSELYPYKTLIDSGWVKGIMTAHIVNRTLDHKKLPGTLSASVIGILRDFLDYDGVIFSDDMHMGAISKHYGLKKSIQLAIKAGVDVLLFSNHVFDDEKTSLAGVRSIILELLKEGKLQQEHITSSYYRVIQLKQELGLLTPNYHENLAKRLKSLY
ncbi:MAG: glycoside hydrolase family 3 protein [Cyclobacteriaceae bacterium]|nr:glycoside hydrolase family 3 protein [Cyclobacteriaceae bacterium HetDA_MAG_MS6]